MNPKASFPEVIDAFHLASRSLWAEAWSNSGQVEAVDEREGRRKTGQPNTLG
jgi:hypothetical protein